MQLYTQTKYRDADICTYASYWKPLLCVVLLFACDFYMQPLLSELLVCVVCVCGVYVGLENLPFMKAFNKHIIKIQFNSALTSTRNDIAF